MFIFDVLLRHPLTVGSAEALPILCVRYVRWERERETAVTSPLSRWNWRWVYISLAKKSHFSFLGDEFTLSLAKNIALLVCPFTLPVSPFLRPAASDPEVVCQKNSFLKVSVSLGGFGPSVTYGKHSVRRRCVQATKNKAETCSLLDAIGRRWCGRWRDLV